MRSVGGLILGLIAVMATVLLLATPADALPSFAAQTGQPCTACHIGGFGPQLTPFGRAFKIGGYTQSGGEGWRAKIPFSAMVLGSFTNTATDQPGPAAPHYAANNNFALDQVGLFLAGGFGEYSGALAQFTYSNIDNTVHLDNTDLRPFTTVFGIGNKDLRVGVTVNNNPTVQDPYNSTYAWGYPFVSSVLAPTPSAQPILNGAFGGNSIGVTAYAWYDSKLYVEGGAYQTMSPWLLTRVGTDYAAGSTQGFAPYLRAAYEWNWSDQSAHVGATFMQANVNPVSGTHQTDGSFGQDNYLDYSFDAGYQFLGDGTHIVTVDGIYTHEDQTLNGTTGAFNAGNATSFGAKSHLDQIRLNAAYWYKNTYGLNLAWQRVWGPVNQVLYSGNTSFRPDSNAFTVEADWVPFGKDDSWMQPYANLKLGIQYTAYTSFEGSATNYDGTGRKASDNNTIYMFAWLAF
jgi:hypothetical protein